MKFAINIILIIIFSFGCQPGTEHETTISHVQIDSYTESQEIGSGAYILVDKGEEVVCAEEEVARQLILSHIDGGHDATCGLDWDKHLHCWGGNPDFDFDSVPTDVEFESIDMQMTHGCGITTDKRIECFGQANHIVEYAPKDSGYIDLVQSYALSEFIRHDQGQGLYSCGLKEDGEVICWGFRDQPSIQVRLPDTFKQIAQVTAYDNLVERYALTTEICGVTVDGHVRCWRLSDEEEPALAENLDEFELNVTQGNIKQVMLSNQSWITDQVVLYEDGSVELGFDTFEAESFKPKTKFRTLIEGANAVLGLTESHEAAGLVAFLGGPVGGPKSIFYSSDGPLKAHKGKQFVNLFPTDWGVCGQLESGELDCWDYKLDALDEDKYMPPSEEIFKGKYYGVSSSVRTQLCGISQTNGSISCKDNYHTDSVSSPTFTGKYLYKCE